MVSVLYARYLKLYDAQVMRVVNEEDEWRIPMLKGG